MRARQVVDIGGGGMAARPVKYIRSSYSQRVVLLGAVIVLAGVAAPAAGAAIFNVATAAQLETAVATANGNGEDDTIVLSARVFALPGDLVAGNPFVTPPGETLILRGPASGQAVIEGSITAFRPTIVRDLTIRGNGGTTGIDVHDPVVVERTTLVNHEIGLWASTDSATVTNSTISGNEVGLLVEDELVVRNSTVVDNPEFGVRNFAHVTADNTIIADNGGDCEGRIDAGSNNLDSDGTCWSSGASGITAVPLLGPLQDNGGPTPTHALLPGSPAIDLGASVVCPATDQRGVTRPKGIGCDIGAFEQSPFEFEQTAAIVGAGGTLTTDGEGDGATPNDPVETTVTHPNGGAISIREGPDAAAEFGFIGQRVVLDVIPNATVADPFAITFLIDASVIPAGQDHNTIQVFKDGVAVPACTGAGATPDPCVAAREAVGTDAKIVVRTSSASDWDFAPGTAAPPAITFSGFLAPLRDAPAVNAGKAGRTYAVKWQLQDANGNFVGTLAAVAGLFVQQTSCGAFTSEPTDAEDAATTGGTSLRYDSDANQYVFNWATPATPGCYALFLELESGETFPAYFRLS
jgi:hypothetical protein